MLRWGAASMSHSFLLHRVRRAESRVWASLTPTASAADSWRTRIRSNWAVTDVQILRLALVACSDKQELVKYPGKKNEITFGCGFSSPSPPFPFLHLFLYSSPPVFLPPSFSFFIPPISFSPLFFPPFFF